MAHIDLRLCLFVWFHEQLAFGYVRMKLMRKKGQITVTPSNMIEDIRSDLVVEDGYAEHLENKKGHLQDETASPQSVS